MDPAYRNRNPRRLRALPQLANAPAPAPLHPHIEARLRRH